MRYWQDCRSRWLRFSVWFLGRALLVGSAFSRGAVSFWSTYGGANFLLNTMAVVVAVGGSVLLWWTIFEPVVPLRTADLLSVNPAERIVDRRIGKEFTIRRRICMDRGAWARVHRMFVGSGGNGIEHNLSESPPIFLPPGCHERVRTMEVPDSLPPGEYAYRVRVEFCNRVRCEVAWVQDLHITIIGPWPAAGGALSGARRDPM